MFQLIRRAIRYTKNNGIESFLPRVERYFCEKNFLKNYYKKTKLTSSEIEEQKSTKFEYEPVISIIIPLYNTPIDFFNELIDTIVNQTYEKWELCLADGTAKETEVTNICKKLMEKDSRIKYKILESNMGISGNTNAALEMATGEFIMLTDHDDLLEIDALYECVKAINEDNTIDSLYTDEDKIDMKGKIKTEPHLKPDFNIEYLRTNNYICHIFVTRRAIALEVGGFCSEYDGAQDFDFILKCTEKSRTVYHVPRVLYHWRCHMNSTAGKPESKLYAYEAGAKAIKAHYDRCGIDAEVKRQEKHFGYYVAERKVDTIQKSNVKIISETDVKVINELVKYCNEDYILLVDKKIKYTEELIDRLLEYAVDNEVSAVSAKITDEKKKVIQGPMMLGVNGLFEYSMKGVDVFEPGYNRRNVEPQNVTIADCRCIMLKKAILVEQNGLDENMPLGLAIFDYCLNAEKNKKRTVLTPYTYVVYEGEDKYLEFSMEESAVFKEKWRNRIEEGDPYYNKNFSINRYLFC